eukprot:1146375-Pelagomonas_calceolata.AAC.1
MDPTAPSLGGVQRQAKGHMGACCSCCTRPGWQGAWVERLIEPMEVSEDTTDETMEGGGTRGCSADGGAHSAPGHPARHLWPPGAPAGRQCGAQPGHSTRQRYNGPPGGASAAGAHVLVCVCECARVRCLHFSLHEEAWC